MAEFTKDCKYAVNYKEEADGMLVYTLRNDCTLKLNALLPSLVEYWAVNHNSTYDGQIANVTVVQGGEDVTPKRETWLREFKEALTKYRAARQVGSGVRRQKKTVKVHTGPRGGKYYVKNGRKCYV